MSDKKMNNVALGCGGFTEAFYKVFWCYLKHVVLGETHQIFEDKSLPISLRLGIIAIILKGAKDKRYIANWRPLTLLETLYKLLSSLLAMRLKPVLNNLLGCEQKAYIPGRFISECTRNTYDIFQHEKIINLPGFILLTDFEKAFDSVGFDFILTTLDVFNFGEVFKEWIQIILGINKDANFLL